MKLLFVIDSLGYGGAERSVADLLPALTTSGVEAAVVQLEERFALADELRAGGTRVWTLQGTSRVARLGELRRLIRDERPSVVHTQLFESDLVGRLAAASLRTPVVSSLVNIAYGRSHGSQPSIRRTRVRAARAADAATGQLVTRFHSVSRAVAEVMGPRLLIPRRRIEVVPRGRADDRLGRASAARRARSRAQLGLDPNRSMVLAVGRHEWQKGFDVLMAAAEGMRQREITVVIAGREGNETSTLQAAVDRARLDVEFLGARDDIGDLMAAADVLAMPSRREGLPGTLIEALALEVPIVSTDIAPVREVVAGLPAVRLVPPDSPESLGRALIEILDESPAPTGHRARFEQRYSMAAVSRSMLSLYERAIG